MQDRAIVAFQFTFLRHDGHSVSFELVDNPLLTIIMGFTVHGTRTEVALLLTEQIGTVGIESRPYGGLCLRLGGSLLAETARGEGEKE